MPEIIVISDDDDAQTGIPEQTAASSWFLAVAAPQQEPVITAANLHPPAPVAQCLDGVIAVDRSISGHGDDIPLYHLTSLSIPELPAAPVRHLISAKLHQEPPIAAANWTSAVPLTPPVPIPQCADGVAAPHIQHSPDASAADVAAAGPLGARHAMHAYFAQFAGCRNRALEVVPVVPCDANVLDLRNALPPMQWPPQFLDLEAIHVDAFLGDSSGRSMDSFSGSNSLDSFIDDAPVEIAEIDIANVAKFVADVLPITADVLRLPGLSPATVAASKRRCRVVSSASSSPPPPPPRGNARRRVVESMSPSPSALAPPQEVV